jgi:Endonuclease NucS
MPIHHAIWQVGEKPTPLHASKLAAEEQLREMIIQDPRILSNDWMIIGREVPTYASCRLDLLAIQPDGSLVLIELKRHRTPRDVVAQSIDYASWLDDLTADRIVQIYAAYSGGGNLQGDFQKRFGAPLDEDSLNAAHQIIIVASELDSSTERIVAYLNARDIAINVLFFKVFEHAGQKLLSRAWMIDPGETQANAAATTPSKGEGKEPWNGEFYVSYGADRSWEDARKYGFISGGGGTWYSQTLKLLSPGDRVWVRIPQTGYVGVGEVTEVMQSIKDFTVPTPNGSRPALDVLENAAAYAKTADDPDQAEYFVRVNWLDTVDAAHAFNEVGLFGLQHTVCQPRAAKWRHTVDRLKTVFLHWNK